MKTLEKLNKVIDFLNEKFNQASPEYNFILGAKPQVIRFDNETAISTWACGAIVCIEQILYFVSEDDGNWFGDSQCIFNIGWADSFIEAMNALNNYVKENGTPVRYVLGSDKNGNTIYGEICNYKLE